MLTSLAFDFTIDWVSSKKRCIEVALSESMAYEEQQRCRKDVLVTIEAGDERRKCLDN